MWYRDMGKRLNAVLVLSAAGWAWASTAVADDSVAPTQFATAPNWTGERIALMMPDGSEFTEYQVKTVELGAIPGAVGATFAVGFHPRFACTPMFSISIPGSQMPTAAVEADAVSILIDGAPVAWPVIVDTVGSAVVISHYDEPDAAAAALKLLDISDMASMSLSDSTSGTDYGAEFSLLGSRVSSNEARVRCRNHVPKEWMRNAG